MSIRSETLFADGFRIYLNTSPASVPKCLLVASTKEKRVLSSPSIFIQYSFECTFVVHNLFFYVTSELIKTFRPHFHNRFFAPSINFSSSRSWYCEFLQSLGWHDRATKVVLCCLPDSSRTSMINKTCTPRVAGHLACPPLLSHFELFIGDQWHIPDILSQGVTSIRKYFPIPRCRELLPPPGASAMSWLPPLNFHAPGY